MNAEQQSRKQGQKRKIAEYAEYGLRKLSGTSSTDENGFLS
jgi:hypothetical protein